MSERDARAPEATLPLLGGVPTIHLDGQPHSGMAYMTYWPKSGPLHDFGQAGVHLYSFPSTSCHHLWENMVPACWSRPDHFEYSHLDRQIEQILAADPQALIFPRVYLMSPRWWDQLHPDQLVTCDDGAGNYVPYYEGNQKRCPSWASEVWRADTAESLRRYIAHIEAAPYAEHVIGYHVASGTTEEWMYWGGNAGQYCDFSAANLQGFKRWLRARYAEDTAALRSAWSDPSVDFENVTIPSKADRLSTEYHYFRDPAREGRVIDYIRYTSAVTAETICYFAKVVKDASARRAFCGVFYGYILQLSARDHRWQNAGHLALKDVLASPDIDFICSPSHYSARQLGQGGYSVFMSATESIKRHGKTWFDENDYRTFLAHSQLYGKTNTLEDTIAVERREIANVLGNGVCMWWFDLSSETWFTNERLLVEIAHHREIAERSLRWDRRPVSEIGVLVDENTVPYLQMESDFPAKLIISQLPELGRLGAPFSIYLLDDLEEILTGDEHKLWVMLNLFGPTDAHRRAIEQKLQRAGHTLLWLYAPGFVRGQRLDEEAMRDLTGIHIRHANEQSALWVQPVEGDPGFVSYGYQAPIAPVFWADDAEAAIWGTLVGREQAGLVAKNMDSWRSVYSAAPCLPSGLLRRIAQEAGVHIYSDQDDIIYANQQLLGVCVDRGGSRRISLPAERDVFDLFARKPVGRQLREFNVDLPANQTGLYYLGDLERM